MFLGSLNAYMIVKFRTYGIAQTELEIHINNNNNNKQNIAINPLTQQQ